MQFNHQRSKPSPYGFAWSAHLLHFHIPAFNFVTRSATAICQLSFSAWAVPMCYPHLYYGNVVLYLISDCHFCQLRCLQVSTVKANCLLLHVQFQILPSQEPSLLFTFSTVVFVMLQINLHARSAISRSLRVRGRRALTHPSTRTLIDLFLLISRLACYRSERTDKAKTTSVNLPDSRSIACSFSQYL